MHLFIITSAAMVAFAANSVLARLALEDGAVDASTYSFIRLASGALVLAIISGNWFKAVPDAGANRVLERPGDFRSGLALLIYVVGFSFAYLALNTGMGALILFTCVQATMIGWGVYSGERPSPLQWTGMAVAFAAFVALISPGLDAPDGVGTGLMVAAGIAWGIYSLRGRGAENPLEMTSGNFQRATLMAVPLLVTINILGSLFWPDWPPIHLSGFGLTMAVISGAVTSGLGYALWYRCLRQLTATNAAIVQLTVPVIATVGGVAFAGEQPSLRLAVCSALILGGVALVLLTKQRRALGA